VHHVGYTATAQDRQRRHAPPPPPPSPLSSSSSSSSSSSPRLQKRRPRACGLGAWASSKQRSVCPIAAGAWACSPAVCGSIDQLRDHTSYRMQHTGYRIQDTGKKRRYWLVLKEIVRAARCPLFFSSCVGMVLVITSKQHFRSKISRREFGGPAQRLSDCKRQSSNSRGNILPPPLTSFERFQPESAS
jgi:hypothetical protein